MDQQGPGGQPSQQQVMQMFQQKIGNLELTINALITALTEEGVVDEDQINEKAQEIMQDIQAQQEQQAEDAGDDIADQL